MAEDDDSRKRRAGAAPQERITRLRADISRAAEAMDEAAKARRSKAARGESLVRSMMGAIERGERARPGAAPVARRPGRGSASKAASDPDAPEAFEAAFADPETRQPAEWARGSGRGESAEERRERVRALRARVTPDSAPDPRDAQGGRKPKAAAPASPASPASEGARNDEDPFGGVAAAPASAAPLRVARTPRFAGFEWTVASRYLRSRRKEGFISVIAGLSLAGIAIGVAALIIVMAVMTGFREKLIDQIVGVNAHMNVVAQTERFENYDSLAAAIREVDGVERVSPVVEGQVLATSDRGHSGVIVRGMRRADLEQLKVVADPEHAEGSLAEFREDYGVAIGSRLAAKLGLRLGDSITLISPDGDITPFGTMPRSKSYPVVYVFQIGLHEYDSVFVYMPLEEAQIYFNKKGRVDSLEVMVEDPNRVEEWTADVRRAARQSIGLHTWKDLNGSFIGALDVERNVMFIILALIILVAALNIISGLVMLVKDKARDVAIMRTMGMSRGSVLRIFFMCGAAIGVVGAVAGTIIGVLFCTYIDKIQAAVERVFGVNVFPAEIYGLSGLPAKMTAGDVLFTLALALGLSFLATLYPAWRAASLDPVEALRYE